MSEQSVEAVMAQAMQAENRRREVASQTPGLGALLPTEQPPNGPGVGKYELPGLDITGEGYDVTAPDDAQQKAYGMARAALCGRAGGRAGLPACCQRPGAPQHH